MLSLTQLIQIEAWLRQCANTIILPRFNNLAEHESYEKAPNDYATIADIEAEAFLTPLLQSLITGSLVVGEETVAQKPEIYAQLGTADNVWVLDPLDGTGNFRKGVPNFGTLLSLVQNGVVVAGWLYHIPEDKIYVVQKGQGVCLNGEQIVATPCNIQQQAVINVSKKSAVYGVFPHKGEKVEQLKVTLSEFVELTPCEPSVSDFIKMIHGKLDAIFYTGSNAWDCLAGTLAVHEMGGACGKINGQAIAASLNQHGQWSTFCRDATLLPQLQAALAPLERQFHQSV
jgi:fructose-1,6-bisphosphatase/inositol monophosphatase family enzyme